MYLKIGHLLLVTGIPEQAKARHAGSAAQIRAAYYLRRAVSRSVVPGWTLQCEILTLMALSFSQTSEDDLPRIRTLLRKAFKIEDPSANPSLLDKSMILWKYWAPRSDWEGSRSYSLMSGGDLQAHGAVIPMVYEGAPAPITAQHFIDWVASPGSLSGGSKLLRRLFNLADLTLAIGGSQDTRRILSMLQFQPIGTVQTMVVPVRPWLQARTHQYKSWKLPLRLMRNALWHRAAPSRSPPGWDYQCVELGAVPDPIWTARGEPGTLWRRRSPSLAAYYLACPGVRFRLFLARENGVARGCFLLALCNGTARIADLWLVNANQVGYERMYCLALVASQEAEDVAEVIAYSSIVSRAGALQRCGFRCHSELRLMAYSQGGLPFQTLDCQMIDNDAAFLHGAGPAYLT
jgi:hypothetical protein